MSGTIRQRVHLLTILSLCAVSALAAESAPIKIGVVIDGPWLRNNELREMTVREVTVLTEGEFDVSFPDSAYLIGDWTLETAEKNINKLLADPEIDIVIAWGLISSHAVCCLGELDKPVLAPVVLDPELQGLPLEAGMSGVHNLNYVALPDTLAEELETFRRVVPFQRIAILTNASLIRAVPEIVERTASAFDGTGVDFEYVPVGESAGEALAAISDQADAVYVWPLFQFSPEEYQRLIDGLIERRLPSFSSLGGGEVEAGMLASAGSAEFFPKLARRIGLNVQRILLGEDPGELPVGFSVRHDLVINMATARAIDVSPRWEVMIEARVLNLEDVEGAYELSLDKAVSEAIELNLDLIVRRQEVEAGALEVERARADRRPQVEVSASGLLIDDDRAAGSLGSQAERTATAGLSLTQLIYSDPVSSNRTIQELLQEGRQSDLESLRLDTALEAASTYLNLMRARALERIQHNNVDRTRSDLEISRTRQEIGVASAGEVLRWQTEIANARKALVEAVADRRTAEIAVNRMLHRPLDALFVARDVELGGGGLLTGQLEFQGYVDTPRGYSAFVDFVVREGLAKAPELAEIDSAVAAQDRFVLSSRRAFWAPTIALQAALDEQLVFEGAGSDAGAFDLPADFPVRDGTDWSLALKASLPLFSGGARAAERTQAEIELERLALQRSAIEERLEQRIRTALEQARSSLLGIRFSRRAAEAAGENLELVRDAYARGVSSLLDLLDAQTASLNAEEVSANALYDFLIDWLESKRAANALGLFNDPEAQRERGERLKKHLIERNVMPADTKPQGNTEETS